jgi:hypothetical protein
MTKLVIFLAVIAPHILLGQTCVIAKITKSGIFVGADSRCQRITWNELTHHVDTTKAGDFCKIRTTNQFHYAVINQFSETSIKIADQVGLDSKFFDDFEKDYAQLFANTLSDSLKHYLDISPQYVYQSFPYDTVIATTIIFGYENDSPRLAVIAFRNVEPELPNTIKVNASIYQVTDGVAAGETQEIADLIKQPQTWKGDPKKTLLSLLQMVSTFHIKQVGPPYNIMKVTSKGYKWVLNGCDQNASEMKN